jgi:hypothetical protein
VLGKLVAANHGYGFDVALIANEKLPKGGFIKGIKPLWANFNY